MRKLIKTIKIRYGSVSVLLTALVLAAVVILNVIVAMLSTRYEWMYMDMNSKLVYNISDNCEAYLSEHIFPRIDEINKKKQENGEANEKVKIIFCRDKEEIEKDDMQKYILESVYQVDELFEGYIEIDYLNIWEKPSVASSYGVTSTSDVVCSFDGKHEAMNLEDFYVYSTVESAPIAYNGEKIIAATLLRVTQKTTPMCYFTTNHGEKFDDFEFMRAVAEAGYNAAFLDLSKDDIPSDCELLVTFAPKQDFVTLDGLSSVSETDKLDAYMNNGGKYMIFLSADTFISGEKKNMEGFLRKWGMEYMHFTDDDGSESCYLIKDSSHSLSVDGYTVISEKAQKGYGKDIFGSNGANVFGNSTCIRFANDFESDGNGNYVKSVDGKERYAYPLMLSHSSAEAWAGGRAVARASDEPFVLMAMASQDCANGKKAQLVASASTEFASERVLQSAVLGNNQSLAYLFKNFGRESVPTDLVFKSFGSTDIEGLSTQNANILTAVLALVPVITCAAFRIVVLVRRKNL